MPFHISAKEVPETWQGSRQATKDSTWRSRKVLNEHENTVAGIFGQHTVHIFTYRKTRMLILLVSCSSQKWKYYPRSVSLSLSPFFFSSHIHIHSIRGSWQLKTYDKPEIVIIFKTTNFIQAAIISLPDGFSSLLIDHHYPSSYIPFSIQEPG